MWVCGSSVGPTANTQIPVPRREKRVNVGLWVVSPLLLLGLSPPRFSSTRPTQPTHPHNLHNDCAALGLSVGRPARISPTFIWINADKIAGDDEKRAAMKAAAAECD